MRARAALVALIASATADRPQVVATRSTEASPAPPVLPTAGRANVVAYSSSTAAQRHTDAKRPLLKSRRNDQKLALRHVLDTSRAVREAAHAVNKAKSKLAEARRRCPEMTVVPPRFERYQELSSAIMSAFENFSPNVEAISLDEAFLDMSGAEEIFGPPASMAKQIQHQIHQLLF